MKLRTFLTVSGVVIAIAAFVAMLSFGAGNQRLITEQFNELGLFSTMYVYPPDKEEPNDSLPEPVLDQQAVETLAGIPGVNLAYPLQAFSVTVVALDTQIVTKAQALPGAAVQTKIFSQLVAGSPYSSDSAGEAMVTENVLEALGIKQADSAIGMEIVVSVQAASIDSGLTRVIQSVGERIGERVKDFRSDSYQRAEYWQQAAREELNGAMMRFFDGFMNARATISDTLTIVGVLKGAKRGRLGIDGVIIPIQTAFRFKSGGFTGDVVDLASAASQGKLFLASGDTSTQSYSRVTLDLDPKVLYQPIRDSVQALGFRTFSFAEQYDQIQRAFFYFDLALGLVGLIALITASLGIVNTMVMSIVERTREIGVMKSLGADESEIRRLFLVESGAIGGIGAAMGILFGWLITRIASLIAKTIMENQGVDAVELFALPLWLVLIAFTFGLLVSLAAGFYPASRAARIDPVEALRNE
ncbi:MAG: ABC transporter permease [Candidatus Zixiibacteriota bacterium]|nr:MAG: ABC transporter permease [candidate division Zixibacteria bacterium]